MSEPTFVMVESGELQGLKDELVNAKKEVAELQLRHAEDHRRAAHDLYKAKLEINAMAVEASRNRELLTEVRRQLAEARGKARPS